MICLLMAIARCGLSSLRAAMLARCGHIKRRHSTDSGPVNSMALGWFWVESIGSTGEGIWDPLGRDSYLVSIHLGNPFPRHAGKDSRDGGCEKGFSHQRSFARRKGRSLTVAVLITLRCTAKDAGHHYSSRAGGFGR